jgi:hypothetical protein
MRSPNNEKNYRLMCAMMVEQGTVRREFGKLLEGKPLDEDERKAMYKAMVEVAEEVARLTNPRPMYTPYSIPEPEEFPPACTSERSVSRSAPKGHRNPVVPDDDSEADDSEADDSEADDSEADAPRGVVHPAQRRRSSSGPPVRDSILGCVAKAGSLRQVDISNQLRIDAKGVYNIVNSMVSDGHVVKVIKNYGPKDKPSTFIELSEKGRQELEKIVRGCTKTAE